MSLYQATGVGAALNFASAGGTVYLVPIQLRGVSATFNRATQPILMSTGGANSLIGYAPSTGAESGFTIGFAIPYNALTAPTGTAGTDGTPADMLTALMAAAGVNVTLTFLDTTGAQHVGDVSCASCIVRTLTITGSEGGLITCTAQLDSASVPVAGTTVSPHALAGGIGDVFKFIDLTKFTIPTYTGSSWPSPAPNFTDCASFTVTIQRQIAQYRGNSVTGIPKKIKVVRTEAMLDAEYLKFVDTVTAGLGQDMVSLAAIGDATASPPIYNQTLRDASVVLTQISAGGAALTITLSNTFHDRIPEQTGDTETYITERAHLKASAGGYSFA